MRPTVHEIVTNCSFSIFQLKEMEFSVAWKLCMGYKVIVRWAHAFLLWLCLPTTVCSLPPPSFYFSRPVAQSCPLVLFPFSVRVIWSSLSVPLDSPASLVSNRFMYLRTFRICTCSWHEKNDRSFCADRLHGVPRTCWLTLTAKNDYDLSV